MVRLRARVGRAPAGKPVLAGKWLALASTVAMAMAGPAAANQPKPTQRPNIVFMMVDNFGYGDLGSYGGGVLRGVPTPNLDRLAQQGLRLTNFNVEPECTPTRSALMTGRMPVRSGTSFVNNRGARDGLANWEYTIAELLSDSGYRTAIFGKWHLGSEPGRMPTNQGFDVWYGIPRSSNEAAWTIQPGYDPALARDTGIWEASKGAPPRRVKAYTLETRRMLDSEITERGVAYIKAHAKSQQPFFLYMPFTLPHTPTVGSPKYVKPGRSQYQNILAEIDGNAGAIIDAVREAGIEDNTIVIFTSDNGPETMLGPGTDYGAQSDSGPFRGEFPSSLEGGIRVPMIVRWPGRTQPGRVSNEIVAMLDFYRTFAQLAGAADKVPQDRAIDSIDQTDFLFGRNEKSARDFVMFFHNGDLHAIKWRNFKTHFRINEPARNAVAAPGQAVVTGYTNTLTYPWVFDLENDPKELWNLNTAHTWVGAITGRILRRYTDSTQQYPNLQAGEDGPPKGP
jgi:arylsulfatase A-like enzyme